MHARETTPAVEGKGRESRRAPRRVRDGTARTAWSGRVERPVSRAGVSLAGPEPPRSPPSERRQPARPHLTHHVLHLQRQHGNRYVQRVLSRSRRASAPNASGPGHAIAGEIAEQHGAAEQGADAARLFSSTPIHSRAAPPWSVPALKAGRPAVQRPWYNFHVPFTEHGFDPSIEGVKTPGASQRPGCFESRKLGVGR